MKTIRNLGDLIDALSVYDRELPVTFRSNEPGGNWPDQAYPMEAPHTEAIGTVAGEDGNPHTLEIRLSTK